MSGMPTQAKYNSNFRRLPPWLHVRQLTLTFIAGWFTLLAAADQHLTEQRRNRLHGLP